MKSKTLTKTFIILLSFFLLSCQSSHIKKNGSLAHEGHVDSEDNVPIYYAKTENRNTYTLMFIHGLGCNSSYWKAQKEYFSKDYQVVTIDLAGHGLSDSNRKNFTINQFANDIVAVIDELQLTNVVLIGQSIGSAAAIESTLIRADKVIANIAVNSFESNEQWPKASEIEATMRPYRENFYKTIYPEIKNKFAPYTDKALIYQIAKDIALTPPDIGISTLESMYLWMANNYANSKSKLTVPLIHINSQSNSKADTKQNIFIAVKTSGYFSPLEAPNKFNQALELALEKI